ncbi:MAG: serine hydrolase domain-containing protein [Candidatus Aquilonibacter sp.]
MSFRYLTALACCAALTTALTRSAVAAPTTASIADPSVQRAIVTTVEKNRAIYGGRTPVPGVLVAVWDADGRSYVHGFGYADLPKKRPLTVADHFRIGSNTKTFVASVILQLAREGKLRLDDPLSKFNIGVTIPNGANITIRQILDMRSGLFEAYEVPELNAMDVTASTRFDPRQIIRWAVAQKPYFAPGTGYHYSNTGYLIAGLIIEAVTHDTVKHQIEQRLLVPFKLTQTSVPTTQAMPAPRAHGYGLDAKKQWEDVGNGTPVSLMGAAGDMISDANDIRRWIKLFVNAQTGEAAGFSAIAQCKTFNGNLGFGLGLACAGDDWYGYTGGLPGYNTAEYYSTKTGTTVLVWVDVQNGTPPPGVANAIFRAIAGIVDPGSHPFNTESGKI